MTLPELRALAADPTATTGQIVDALATVAALPDWPCALFLPRLTASGWSDIRPAVVRACDAYAAIHADADARRDGNRREAALRARIVAFWQARGVEDRDVQSAVRVVLAVDTHWTEAGVRVPRTAATAGLNCSLTTGLYPSRPIGLDKAHPATKPIRGVDVTAGTLRRLAALGLVEHRDQRLFFTPAAVDALREARIIGADGLAVPS